MGKYANEKETLKIKSYVVGAGYNITTLAKEIGMTRESLSARINGIVDFSREEMRQVAKCIGVKPEVIFFD